MMSISNELTAFEKEVIQGNIIRPNRSTLPSIQVHTSSTPSSVRIVGLDKKEPPTTLSLKEFVDTRCPSLSKGEFNPAWWLNNGHLQTLYSAIGNFDHVDKITYERRFLRLSDGGTLGLDFTGPDTQNQIPEDTTIVLTLHGITGGSNEAYVRSVLRHICAPKYEGGLGYRGVVMNFRGCAGVPLTSVQFYSAGYTDDLRITILYLQIKYPKAKLLGIGFSLGASVLTRYLGEEGSDSRLLSGCALACPWDLVQFSNHIESGWFTRNLYSKALAKSLQTKVKENIALLRKRCPEYVQPHLDVVVKARNPQVVFMDEHLTRFLGGSSPPFPLASAQHYYRWASCYNYVSNIRVPLLAVNALDDPMSPVLPVPIPEQAGYAILAITTRGGGHLGWFEGGRGGGWWKVERWVNDPIIEWIRATAEELVPHTSQAHSEVTTTSQNGFTCLDSNPKIAFKEIATEMVMATNNMLENFGTLLSI